MAEVDYQLALLLQHQYEQEKKDCEVAKALEQSYKNEYQNQIKQMPAQTNLNDSILAKSLEEQFRTELEVDTHGNNLAYSGGSSSTRNNARSLTDPSWEVIDPTPDIHNLFMVFNEKFFWNQLGSVCVYWSKRMTSCAGICTYQGRGGMCTISLSEPLLKLRPRKDLVETLLHEMIHAYLFVTNNNRDRDGHGPEFHRHMHRINNEAGTKISVYHDFHDEVKLYKQHWWKCTGPCQKWSPYFGMVRRAMNRAPGPADRWWGEHSQKCGGKFIKVKEPEKVAKLPLEKPKNQPDIRKFLTPTEISKKSSSDNIKTISTNNPNSSVNKVISNSSNIFGFSNLGSNNNNKNNMNKEGALLKNNSNTIVINKKSNTSSNAKSKVSQSVPDKSRAKSVPEKTISTPIGSDTNYAVVRNHWINKFSNSVENITENKPSTSNTSTSKDNTKRKSLDLYSSSLPKIPKVPALFVACPNCSQNIFENQINSHLDTCLNLSAPKNCDPVTSISSVDFEEKQINDTDDCHYDVFEQSSDNISSDNLKQCEVCQKMVSIDEYGVHIDHCLHGVFDRIEEEYNFNESKDVKNEPSTETKCLVCSKTILKSLLNDHLEDCMNLSNIFEDKNEPVEGCTETVENSEIARNNVTYNCPSCMELVSESKMNDHIDICLDISNASNST